MQVQFSKYSGCGNDFILIDHRSPFLPQFSRELVQKLCHRHKGIGADGIILLEKSAKADYRMRIFNADGSEAEMCGNGLRCLAKFLQELGENKKNATIETLAGIHEISRVGDNIKASMGAPKDLRKGVILSLVRKKVEATYLDTGVPHAVVFEDQLANIPVAEYGRQIRFHPNFAPKGANANFVEKLGENRIDVRTYERGVEAETLACGTGATASAIAFSLKTQAKPPIEVKTRSGDTLIIDFSYGADGQIEQVTQTGPAEKNYQGIFKID